MTRISESKRSLIWLVRSVLELVFWLLLFWHLRFGGRDADGLSFDVCAGFNSSSDTHGRKRKLLSDGLSLSPPEPLRVSEFQTHQRTRLDDRRRDEARALSSLDLANPQA